MGVSDEEWKKLDRKPKSTIELYVSDSVLLNVSGEAMVKALWDKLRTLYQSESLVNKLFLRKRFYNLRMKDGDSMIEHLMLGVEPDYLLYSKVPPNWTLVQNGGGNAAHKIFTARGF